jgi:Icc protein
MQVNRMHTAIEGVEETDLRHLELPPGTLRVVQITDTHLYAKPASRLLGVNTLDSFRSVISEIRQAAWPADLVLATGDLVHDASAEGYRQFAALLEDFGCEVCCLPGNHDEPGLMRKHLCSGRVSSPRVVDSGHWRIVLLDSVTPGKVGGHLDEAELQHLAAKLQHCDRPTLIALHHQPVPIGSAWIDQHGLDNAAELLAAIHQAPQVRGILWGHVHQAYDRMHGAVRFMASPSTCVQFAPHSRGFTVDRKQPGFRLLALTPDGRIHTQVLRIPSMPAGLELSSSGYA